MMWVFSIEELEMVADKGLNLRAYW